jgi:hypothetical protein
MPTRCERSTLGYSALRGTTPEDPQSDVPRKT